MPDPIGILPIDEASWRATGPAIDLADVRFLRFEVGLYLDEIAQRAADMLEAVGIVRKKLKEMEAAYEGREARTATLTTPEDTE